MTNILKNIISKYLTVTRGSRDIPETREINTPPIRETKPAADSFKCPYCFSIRFVRRGTRQKKLEIVQLYLCNDCGKTFTPHLTKGKHYPLPTILDALAIYHLGYSLEQTCRIVNRRTANPESQISLQPSTLANWLTEFKDNLPFSRMREFALKRYSPVVIAIPIPYWEKQSSIHTSPLYKWESKWVYMDRHDLDFRSGLAMTEARKSCGKILRLQFSWKKFSQQK